MSQQHVITDVEASSNLSVAWPSSTMPRRISSKMRTDSLMGRSRQGLGLRSSLRQSEGTVIHSSAL